MGCVIEGCGIVGCGIKGHAPPPHTHDQGGGMTPPLEGVSPMEGVALTGCGP